MTTQQARFHIGGLDCPTCAAKVEHVIGRIDGVTGAQIAGWQEIIDAQAENFLRDVRRGRGVRSTQWTGGQTWIARTARQLGLIDEVI